ncbi:MAG: zinc ribbon domain-containing protein [Opitutae bacterium]|nr:zinc ribbon domain-containing protein [Opitutae bacterium]
MPTYDYVCPSCGGEFEFFQSMMDAPLTRCPTCSDRTLRRKIGIGAGIIFKGSGFYQTDYKNSGKPSEAIEAKAGNKKEGEKTDGDGNCSHAGGCACSDNH